MRPSCVRKVSLPSSVPADQALTEVLKTPHRLKMSLNLPAVNPRPPVPPRAYKKVFAYISSALSNDQPSSRPQSAANTPSRTPSKRKFDALQRTPQSSPTKAQSIQTRRSSRKQPTVQDDEDYLPEYTMLAIRSVCQRLRMPYAAPHVFTGVSSIVKLQSERASDAQTQAITPSRKKVRRSGATLAESEARVVEINETTIPALIVCVALMTIAELSAEAPTKEETAVQKELAIMALRGVVPDELADGYASPLWGNITALQAMAPQAGWAGMQWFLNIEPPEDRGDLPPEEADLDGIDWNGAESTAEPSSVDLRVRFGNVKAVAIDWLSEERKAQYAIWRAGIMAEIEKLGVEAAG